MKRYEDIQAVLEDCASSISRIKERYEAARSDESQLEILKPVVKSALEQCRSVLEYSAQDIWESYTKKKNSPHFPYGKDEESFSKSLRKNLPGLDTQRPDLLQIVCSIQPHICGSLWLYDFCVLTNFNKHDRLKPQVRRDSPSNTISIGDGGMIMRDSGNIRINQWRVNGVLINREPLVLSNSMSQQQLRGMVIDSVQVKKEHDWVEFHFEGSMHDVLKLLDYSHAEIGRFVEELNKRI